MTQVDRDSVQGVPSSVRYLCIRQATAALEKLRAVETFSLIFARNMKKYVFMLQALHDTQTTSEPSARQQEFLKRGVACCTRRRRLTTPPPPALPP